jgi:hypothetical protein
MKKRFCIFIFISLQTRSLYPDETPHIHITIHNDSNSTSNQTITKVNSMYDEYSSYFEKMYQDRYKILQTTKDSYFDIIMHNKIKTALIAVCTGYAFISYKLYCNNQMIDHTSAWNRWKSDAHLEELLLQPHQKLEIDLLFMIQNYYTDPMNPTNFIYSITQASIALEEELQALERQKTLYDTLTWLEIASLFCIDEKSINELDQKYKKVLFMKHIFCSWCTQYKIDKNK